MAKFALILCFCLASLATEGLTETPTAAAKPRYNIGGILPLSGASANFGQGVRNGMLLAYEGLEPEVKAGIHLYFEDDEGQAKNALAAFQKLLLSNQLDLVVGALSNSGHAVVPLTEKNGLGYIGITVDPTIVAGTKGAVLLYDRIEDLAQLAVKEALRRGYRKIAIMCTQHLGNLAFKKAFLEANGGKLEVLLNQDALPDETDFRAYITRLHSTPGLDAILNIMLIGQGPVFARQAKQLGVAPPLFSLGNYEDRTAIETSNGAMIGQWYVHSDNPSERFQKRYQERFRIAPGLGSPNGYDAVMLLAAAMRGNVAPKDLGAFLRSVQDFSGELGTYSSTPDNRFTIPIVVKTFTEHGFEKVS